MRGGTSRRPSPKEEKVGLLLKEAEYPRRDSNPHVSQLPFQPVRSGRGYRGQRRTRTGLENKTGAALVSQNNARSKANKLSPMEPKDMGR